MRIRGATTQDLDFIVRCNHALAAETEGHTLDAALLQAGVGAVLADPGLGQYTIAEYAGQPVGQLLTTGEWSDWRNGLFLWVQSVYVLPARRRTGVLRALFGHLQERALADPRVCGIRLYVDRSNTRAQEVYARLGLHRSNYDVMENVFRGPESRG